MWLQVCNPKSVPKQARPAAEEARPAAVGKLLYEAICRWSFCQSSFLIWIPFFLSSTSWARTRISLKQLWNLPPWRDISYINHQKNIRKLQLLKIKTERFMNSNLHISISPILNHSFIKFQFSPDPIIQNSSSSLHIIFWHQ